MRKINLISAAIISTFVASAASAATYTISSDVTNSSVMLGTTDNIPGVNPTNLTISGELDIDVSGGTYIINSGSVTVDGTIGFFAGAPIELLFNGVTSAYNNGVLFDGSGAGGIAFEVNGNGVNNIDLTQSAVSGVIGDANHLGLAQYGLNLGGGTVNGDGTISLGLCGAPDAVGFALSPTCLGDSNTAGVFGDNTLGATVLGSSASIYLAGNITLTEVAAVPVPAAAWLFGSALLGLSTVGRRRVKK
ncbi:VPLPA-CTERM sorting domain-containing protein [Oceanicoccus sp. KOV_DT_Chl]|uniref:VPLPA-CTERM sorting domain-containing protein n=1 Tax=Oceanicoccus sp. KOV_DT_Chl TaxID=1904639 RepID=UPI000C7E1890|nr:VPLPA-CTERM sorting domain-containing protein [Oceanicoccus sp. KOV_DT_Chl]